MDAAVLGFVHRIRGHGRSSSRLGADTEASDRNGLKPLNAAACKGHTKLVKLLLDNVHRTPLMYAAAGRNQAILKTLLARAEQK
ncbi:hypothetical protein B0T25DRAFT_542732 [Lasiosphaeria hispida]|uniref:Ankyrin repeat protein n=1 Tax=Lasiosphaeria hispida TaxID=260671 RepID=A0AAJ0ME38_9PEZI|nr:hypothetical protein B0T25DRAFT_542732 [Lasiosphaeria hispida]